MSEEIVSCSGCGKKFRIPDGAPPGAFDCTACGASVAYGGAAAVATGGARPSRSSGRKRGKSSRRSSRSAAAAKGSATGSAKGSSKSRRGRRSRDAEPEPEETGRRGRRGARGRERPEKQSKTLPLIIGIMGCVLLAAILIIAFTGGDKKKGGGDDVVVPEDNGGDGGLTTGDGTGTTSGGGEDPGTSGTETPSGDTTGTGTAGDGVGDESSGGGITSTPPEDNSGIGDSTGGEFELKDYRHYFLLPLDELFQHAEPIEGTTDAEIAAMTQQVVEFVDMDSGAAGMRAGNALEKVGAKAMPFLINAMCDQWNGGKWAAENEQWASWQLQQTCRRLIQATKMPSEFEARFNPGTENEPKIFKRASRMWVAWWKGTGQHLKEFTPYPEDEEE